MLSDTHQELRRCIRDLVALSALPAIWIGYTPPEIAESLADALVGILRLDLAYVRLVESSDGLSTEVAFSDRRLEGPQRAQALGAALEPWYESARSGPPPSIPNPVGRGMLRIASAPLGYGGGTGMVVAGSRREDFPTEHERLLCGVAANQAAIALHGARLYRQAREAVQAREEFLSIAAHELRNPVASIKGNAELLLRWHERNQLDGGRIGRLGQAIVQGSGRLAILVDDLLDVSRLQGGQLQLAPRPFDLAALLHAVAARQQILAEGHPLRVETLRAPCIVRADADRIEQVLVNLLDNAVKYSPPGSAVDISLQDQDDGVQIRVRDQGIGLPERAAETLFQPFGRAPNAVARNVPGLGLGLYICRRIAEQHAGHIWAESAGEDQGTTICLWLPWGGTGDGAERAEDD